MVLTNLIPVPSMTSGWSVSGTTEVTGYGGGSSIKLTGTTSTLEVTVNTTASIALTPSHIYYARVYGYQTTKAGGSVGFYWPIAEPNFQEGLPLKDAGSWQMYSARNNRTSFSSGSYQFRLDYNNTNIAGVMYFSAPMLIDLTAAFGSGNEPTKEWMDSNIPYFVGDYVVKLQTGDILNYDYTGAVQSVTLPKGTYKFEVWGAQGGNANATYALGGRGGFASGIITLNKKEEIFIYVGQSGPVPTSAGISKPAFNGGGYGNMSSTTGSGRVASGGGASDIRIGTDSLFARVIVAGAGGGSGYYSTSQHCNGGVGGGETGGDGKYYSSSSYAMQGYGATQTEGGGNGYNTSNNYGSFGQGGNDVTASRAGGGGGGGWYGGADGYYAGGGGGSGFVWTGLNAPSGYLLGSEYYLTDASTIAGNTSMPSTSGGTETGHTGNGYARITAIKVDSLNIPVNIGGTWKDANEAYVNIGGSWKTVEAAYVNIGGTWKELG